MRDSRSSAIRIATFCAVLACTIGGSVLWNTLTATPQAPAHLATEPRALAGTPGLEGAMTAGMALPPPAVTDMPWRASAEMSCGERLQAQFNCTEVACADQVQGFINYLELRECTMPAMPGLYWVLLIVWVIFLLYLLGDTADEYFCAVLETFVQVLHITPNLAGVTLLSFGNGAPDVFASLAAFIGGVGDVGLAAILGAGVFVTTVVVGAVALNSYAQVDRRPFLRDVGFYIVAVVYLMIAFIDNTVTLLEALGLVVVYVVFVVVVVIGRRVYQSQKAAKLANSRMYSPTKQLRAGASLNAGSALLAEYEQEHDSAIAPLLSADMLAPLPPAGHASTSSSRTPASRAGSIEVPQWKAPSPPTARGAGSVPAQQASLPKERTMSAQARGRAYSDEWHRAMTDREAQFISRAAGSAPVAQDEESGVRQAQEPGRAGPSAGTPAGGAEQTSASGTPSMRSQRRPARRASHRYGQGANFAALAAAHSGSQRSDLGREPSAPRAPAPAPTREAPSAIEQSLNHSMFRAHMRLAARVMRHADWEEDESRGIAEAMDHGYHNMAGALDTSAARSSAPRRKDVEAWRREFGLDRQDATTVQAALPDKPSQVQRMLDALNVVLAYVLLPSVLMRRVTVPVLELEEEEDEAQPADADKSGLLQALEEENASDTTYDWRFTAASPVLGFPLVLITAYNTIGAGTGAFVPVGNAAPWFSQALLSLILGIFAGGVLAWHLRKHHRTEPPTGALRVVLTTFAFFTSVSWIINVANEIVGVLQAAGELLGIPSAALALTVLAWGNSLGDLICDVSVARRGSPKMGLAAAYAGPMFNLLVGLGLSLAVGVLKQGSIELQQSPAANRISWACFSFLLVSLVSAFIVVPLTNFVITRPHGIALVVLYAAFVTTALYLGLS